MKMQARTGILLLGMGIMFSAYAANFASVDYVDQTFSALQQTFTDLQQQIDSLNT